MDAVPVEDLLGLSWRIARECDPRLRIDGVMSAEGGARRVELLVSIDGSGRAPSTLVLNLDRTDTSIFEAQLRERLRELVATSVAT